MWSRQAWLIHPMWDMSGKEDSRMTPGLAGRATGRMELPLTGVGKTVAGAGLLFGG